MLLGSLLYGLRGLLIPAPVRLPDPIVIRADQVERIRAEWVQQSGRTPTPRELELAISEFVDLELLVREALALGLQHDDAVVKRRLIANQRFVASSDREVAGESDDREANLLREAFSLGLEQTDLVVRRRLVERMRWRILAEAGEPFEPNARTPQLAEPRVALYHVYLSRDRRGAALAEGARTLHARLLREEFSPEEAARVGLGDPLLLPRRLPPSTQRELAAQFGPEFASLALALPTGQWSQPVASSYGLHLVWIEERVELPAAKADDAPATSMADGRAARERAVMQRALAALRAGVTVIREAEGQQGTEAADQTPQ